MFFLSSVLFFFLVFLLDAAWSFLSFNNACFFFVFNYYLQVWSVRFTHAFVNYNKKKHFVIGGQCKQQHLIIEQQQQQQTLNCTERCVINNENHHSQPYIAVKEKQKSTLNKQYNLIIPSSPVCASTAAAALHLLFNVN